MCSPILYAFQTSEISYFPMRGAPACVTDVPLTDSAVLDCHICNHEVRTGRRDLGSLPLRKYLKNVWKNPTAGCGKRQREWLPFYSKSKQK